MRAKMIFLMGMAVGYVLGARAGRERYEQIRMKSRQLWNNPAVQDKVHEAGDAVKATAPAVQHKLTDAAKHATGAARSKLTHPRAHNESDLQTAHFGTNGRSTPVPD
jgi:hypothetical protein